MEDDIFKKEIIKNFIEVCRSFGKHPCETAVGVTTLLEKIERIDQKKGTIINDFIQCIKTIDDEIAKETQVRSIHQKCGSVRNSYKEENYDEVDRIKVRS